jgi:hypothetical protein
MKIKIKYVIENIFGTSEEQMFECNVRSFYEWRIELIKTIQLGVHDELIVKEIKVLDK